MTWGRYAITQIIHLQMWTSIIKEPDLVWSTQKVISEGAVFKLGPKGCMHVNQKLRWTLGTLQARAVRMKVLRWKEA